MSGEPMVTAAADDGSACHRLIYVSRSRLQGSLDECAAGLAEIVAGARRNNGEAGLTSVLALHRGRFMQVVEGTEAAVTAVFQRIVGDDRHGDVRVLHEGPARVRRLPPRPLLLVGHDARSRALLAPGPEAAADGVVPADAETLLAALLAATGIADTPSSSADTEDLPERDTDLDVERLRAELSAAWPARREDAPSPAAAGLAGNATPPGDDAAELEALDTVYATAVISADGVVLRANGNFHTLLGYEAGELAAIGYRDTLHEEDASRLERLWAALGRGSTVKVDRRGLRRDGTEIWLRSVYRPRLDGAGRLRDIVEIATDFTQHQRRQSEDRGQILAINRALAVAHFALDGTILDANDQFLDAMGYRLDEIVGHHHRMFVEPGQAETEAYGRFWAELASGRYRSGEYKRLAKDGQPVWLQATYNPIFDMGGRPFKVVKYASVVTAQKLRQADYQWQIAAIHTSHAVITFDMNGIILHANAQFLDAMGYRLDEIVGHHHRMFVDPAYAHGAEYHAFWRQLGRGQHQAGQYKRMGRDGREVWLQATYNPIFDMEGVPLRVVKYATVVTEEKLRQAEHQGQIAAIHKAQAVISFDLDGTILDANDNFLKAMGYRLAEVRGRHHRMFVERGHGESLDYAEFWRDLGAGRHRAGEYKRFGRDGREVWLQATYSPIFDMSGRPFRIVKYATDITAEKLRRADVDGQIAAIRKAQGVIAFALDGTILDANDGILATFGYTREELVGRHHSILVEPDHAATGDYLAFWETLRSGTYLSSRFKRVGKGGREVWIQATYNPILDPDGRPLKIIKFATDITHDVAMAEAYEDAKRQAQHDSATALPNRVRLASYMAAALAEPAQRLVVLYLDLDRFKPINDTFGHHVGDRVLGEIADRLRRSIAPDQLAARVGGDEFVIVAPGLPDDAIEPLCQRLLDSTSAPIRHDGNELRVSASIGVAVSPTDGTTPDALLRAADSALYRSKQNGRSTFSFYAAAMNERILGYRSAVEDMRRGIEGGEFVLEYQPRFGARDGSIRSVEALVRWDHPERGLIAPDDFIPLAEKSGLIVPLGEWVLRTACRAAVEWSGIGVSVNVSPVQFRGSDIVGIVTAVLEQTGLDPRRLELEITEGVLLEDADRALSALNGLKRIGVALAMDDFGTGYSSLRSLRAFPFDVVKIDRQFVADMEGQDSGHAVVQAILGLGRALGLPVTAEGVETAGQMSMLAQDACEEVQGYHLARPMAAAEVSRLLLGLDGTDDTAPLAEGAPRGRRDAA